MVKLSGAYINQLHLLINCVEFLTSSTVLQSTPHPQYISLVKSSIIMRTSTLLLASLQALTAVAYPLTAESNVETRQASELPKTTEVKDYNWKEGYVAEWPIHSSCNATERHELTEGLRQAVEMAEQAKNHSKHAVPLIPWRILL